MYAGCARSPGLGNLTLWRFAMNLSGCNDGATRFGVGDAIAS
jgi:hypothetical protein